MELFADYVRAGWRLCPILPGRKSPVSGGWQLEANAIANPDVAAEMPGVGLCHAWSGTCALDIDDFEASAEWCAMQGIDLHALWNAPDAVRISSGRPNRGKLLYRLAVPLLSKKIIEKQPNAEGKLTDFNIIDFRCATRARTGGLSSCQDVLPGTVHPDTGKPYAWDYADELVGDWRFLPELPARVKTVWEGLLAAQAPTGTGAPPAPTGAAADTLRRALARKDPDCDRLTWVTILSALHYDTQGSEEGLALADEWSRKSDKYKGFDEVEGRWRSFSVAHASPATLTRELDVMSTEEDFPPVAAPPPPTTVEVEAAAAAAHASEVERKAANKISKKQAIARLEADLVFVSSLDKYFDVNTREALAGDHAIRHLYTAQMPYIRTPDGGRVKPDPVNILKESENKRVANRPGFHPGAGLFFEEDGVKYVNEFIADRVALLTPTPLEIEKIEWLFNRIDDPVFREWLRKFYGHAIQKPGVKIFSAPLIWSETTGNGKSTLVQVIPTLLFGERYTVSVSNSMLASDFNDYLVGKWFVHLSEMHADAKGERNAIAGKLKAWITDALGINPKGSRAYTTRNSLLITAASNKSDAAAIDNTDRRWGVHEMTAARMTEAEGVWMYDEFLKTPRAAGVLRSYFQSVDITGFVPTAPAPETASRQDMVMESLTPEVAAIHDAVDEGRGPFGRDVVHMQEVLDYLKAQGLRFIPSPHKMARTLKSAPLNFGQVRPDSGTTSKARLRLWTCRNHVEWAGATAKDIVTYWQGETDPLAL